MGFLAYGKNNRLKKRLDLKIFSTLRNKKKCIINFGKTGALGVEPPLVPICLKQYSGGGPEQLIDGRLKASSLWLGRGPV